MWGLQEWIHKLEEGEGTRFIRIGTLVLVLLAVTVIYNLREYRNFSTQEAMDLAQLGRNIAEGRGYTTRFIRPLSIHLIQERRADRQPLLKEEHPDLANPPAYPLLLAGLMKVLPFDYKIRNPNEFLKYQPETLIAWFNQALFFLAAFFVFCLGRKLFDTSVGWVTALVFLATNLFWRFSVSGLQTMLLLVIFLGVIWCLVFLEKGTSKPLPQETVPEQPDAPEPALLEKARSSRWMIALAAATGALVGLGALTLYSFGWLILPAAAFLFLYFPERRWLLIGAAVLAFALVMGPWLARNYAISGTLFGTTGFSLYQETEPCKGNRLERSFSPDLSKVTFRQLFHKLVENVREIVANPLPKIGGNWVSAFFLAGLLLQFRSSTLSRLRVFILLSLAVLIVVQALSRTHLSADSPDVNSENILVIVSPMVFLFGVGMFFVLLDQLTLPFAQARYLVMAGFVLIASMPLVLTLMPPRTPPIVYPPYYPPLIQEPCQWLSENELMMTDMPWATAWYGHRQSVWITLRSPFSKTNDFFYLNDFLKPLKALYLTPISMDAHFQSEMLKGDESWGNFIVSSMSTLKVPTGFPLTSLNKDYWPHHYLLMDRVRW
jgi:hypothetical protein